MRTGRPFKYGFAVNNTIEYRTWCAIRMRCRMKIKGYENATICERWEKSFLHFLADMGPRPRGKHRQYSIDRINGDLGYEPNNCRWANSTQQNRNRRNYNWWLTHNGETLTIAEWAERGGIRQDTLRYRLKHGWDIDRAIYAPLTEYPTYEMNGKSQMLQQWADEFGIDHQTLRARLKYGWDFKTAVTKPAGPNGSKKNKHLRHAAPPTQPEPPNSSRESYPRPAR